MDELLEQRGLSFEELSETERETFLKWEEILQGSQLSIEKIKEYIASMREAVEQELTRFDLDPTQDLFLKARLRNYLLMDAFLSTPEKARKQIENAIAGMSTKKA